MSSTLRGLSLALISLTMSLAASAQNDVPASQLNAIKQKLAQRLPSLGAIESARTTPMNGLIELKVGNNVIYSDASGDYVFEGQMVETKSQRNLTDERLEDINRVDFASLPIKDALVWKSGSGKRRMVVFSDPNCGYCKQLEKELQQLKDVTVYTFMIPILSEDSKAKVDSIWCVNNRTQVWLDWMLRGNKPNRVMGMCASPAERNLALAQKLRVQGTPFMVFEDGTRLPSAASMNTIEQRLDRASARSGG